MKLKLFLFTALLALAGSAFAATPPPPASTGAGPMGHHMGPCEKNPSECQAAAAKFDQWCSANADKCTNLKAWAERRIEKCEANPQKCEEMHEKMHERHEERRQDMKGNPKPDEPGQSNEPGPNDNEDQNGDQPPPPSA